MPGVESIAVGLRVWRGAQGRDARSCFRNRFRLLLDTMRRRPPGSWRGGERRRGGDGVLLERRPYIDSVPADMGPDRAGERDSAEESGYYLVKKRGKQRCEEGEKARCRIGTGEGTKSVMMQGNWTEAQRRGSDQTQVFRGIPRLRVPTAVPSIPPLLVCIMTADGRQRVTECGPDGYIRAHLGAGFPILLCESDGGLSQVGTGRSGWLKGN